MTKLIDQLRFEEGLRLSVYLCPAGKRTIGYGHNLDAEPYFKGALIPDEISKAEAESILLFDILSTEDDLDDAWPHYNKIVSNARQDAFLNMAFQLGVHKLMQFKRMLAYAEQGFWASAYDAAMASKWAQQCPQRASRVANQLKTGVPYDVPCSA